MITEKIQLKEHARPTGPISIALWLKIIVEPKKDFQWCNTAGNNCNANVTVL